MTEMSIQDRFPIGSTLKIINRSTYDILKVIGHDIDEMMYVQQYDIEKGLIIDKQPKKWNQRLIFNSKGYVKSNEIILLRDYINKNDKKQQKLKTIVDKQDACLFNITKSNLKNIFIKVRNKTNKLHYNKENYGKRKIRCYMPIG